VGIDKEKGLLSGKRRQGLKDPHGGMGGVRTDGVIGDRTRFLLNKDLSREGLLTTDC
jgi:hypothetical protein